MNRSTDYSVDLLPAVADMLHRFVAEPQSYEVFDDALEVLLEASESRYGLICQLLSRGLDGSVFRTCGFRNLDWADGVKPLYERFEPLRVDIGRLDNLLGEVVRTGDVVVANDPSADPRSRSDLPGQLELSSFLGMPLFDSDGRLVGAIALANRTDGYTPQIAIALQTLSAALGVMIAAIVRDTDRCDSEAALRASESRHRTFVENARDAFFLQDDTGRVIDVNRQACESLGYTRDELIGMSPPDFDPKYDPAQVAEVMQQLDLGMTITFESQHRRRDGTVFPVEIRLTPFWVDGRRQHVAIVRDITKRRQSELKLHDAQEQLALILEGANIGLWDLDTAAQTVVFSKEWKTQLGFREDENEIPVEKWRERLHPDDLVVAQDKVDMTMESRSRDYHAEFRARRKDGCWRWILSRGSALPGPDGTATRMIGVHIDITERKLAEERLRASEERLAEELEVIRRLHEISIREVRHDNLEAIFQEIVVAAVSVMQAERGNLLLLDPSTNMLHLRGHVGFEESFLQYCRQMPCDAPHAACAQSVRSRQRVIVPDVRDYEIFLNEQSQQILADAKVRALVSTPLISRSGQPIGTITVHFGQPTNPDERSLRRIDLLARQAADLVERAQADAELREHEEQLRALVDVSSEIVWTTGPSGEAFEDSPEWRAFTGQTYEEWKGFGWLNTLHPDDHGPACEQWKNCIQTLEPFSCEYRLWHAASQQWRWMHDRGVCLRNSDGSPRMWVGMTSDIHARKAVADADAKLAAIVDSTDDVIYSITLDAVITSWNPAAERLYGYSSGQMIGQSAFKLVPADRHQEVNDYLERIRNGLGVQRLESVRHRSDGSTVCVAITVSPIHDATGKIVGASVIARDITQRRALEAERERLHQEVLASRERLRNMSRRVIESQEIERRHLALELHDEIGQILTSVNLSLEYLRSRVDPAYLARLDESSRVVHQAIEQIRDLSLDLRPASLDMLGLETALRAYARRHCDRASIEVTFDSWLVGERMSPKLETVCFRVAQEALTNIIRHAHARRCWIQLSRCENKVHLVVRDDGVGFDAGSVLDRAARGEGLGILGMRERALLFGGRFEIDSTPGKGTTVKAHFPRSPIDAATAAEQP